MDQIIHQRVHKVISHGLWAMYLAEFKHGHTINICYQLKKIILKILLCKTNSNMLR